MQRTYRLIITFFCMTLFGACNSITQQEWTKLIPKETSLLIVPAEGIDLLNIQTTEYAAYLDDLTPSALQQVIAIDSAVAQTLDLKALALYPSTSTASEFIWVIESGASLVDWAERFHEPFAQNTYAFSGFTVHKLTMSGYQLFASQANDWLIISPSSRTLESSLRAYTGNAPSMNFVTAPQPGELIVNSEELDHWVQQFVNVTHRPSVLGSFSGIEPVTLKYSSADSSSSSFRFDGTITLKDTARSALIRSVSSINKPVSLDRFIASNAASFAIFRESPKRVPPTTESSLQSNLDRRLQSDMELYRDLSLTMNDEFAVVTFPESGLLASGEFLFLRKLQSATSLRNMMNDLASEGLVTRSGNSFYVNSMVLAELIGSELTPFRDFYLSFSRDVAVISKRKGLSESVESDRNRRRVIYYDDTYSDALAESPGSLSGLVWTYSDDFLKFVEPYLMPRNVLTGLTGTFDITMMTFERQENSNRVNFTFRSVLEEGSTQPYDELWVLPIGGQDLSGTPVLANLVGSSTEEIIFSTQDGRIQAIAFDGTVVMTASTEGDAPVGNPVVYDWYGNNQPIIMVGAGTRIYAWNQNGETLPQFPIEVGERISAPIVVTDVLRNGVPEIIAATENRKVHVIDGRGQNVRGWPQFTNSVVTQEPVFAQVDDTWSVWVASQNILHSWLRSGNVRPGYPVFVNGSFTAKPAIFNNRILGVASDGFMYSIGQNPGLSDSLSVSVLDDSLSVRSLYVANNQLNGIGVQENVLLRDSTGFYRADLYVNQSANGSIFMYDTEGSLKVTHSLGQPASATYHPEVLDLNSDGNREVIALAEFGRLFAWEILTGERIYNIPTSGMKYPLIADLNGDGLMELIAQTREGLRCWTINKPQE